MIKHCTHCGKEFEATHGNQKLCEDCRQLSQEERRKGNINKTNSRNKELGVRTTLLYSKDIELLKAIKSKKETIADAFHVILKMYIDNKNKM